FAVGGKEKVLAVAGAEEDSVSRGHVDIFFVEQQVEAAFVENDQLIVVLKARAACTARRVKNVSDNRGSSTYAKVFLTDIAEMFGLG
ncbi:MAG: hypothetical protein ACLGP3_12775, partial [Acidobacteriota bacterium]